MANIVRAGALWGFQQLVEAKGGQPEDLLEGAGLSSSLLLDPDRYISRAHVIDVLDQSATRLETPDFGLQLAAMQDLYVLGVLAFAIRNASDLEEALKIGARYMYYHAPSTTIDFREFSDEGEIGVIVDFGAHDLGASAQAYEHTIRLLAKIIKLVTQDEAEIRRVGFSHSQISNMEVYEQHFEAKPIFDLEVDGITIPKEQLKIPVGRSDPHLQMLVEQFLDFQLKSTQFRISDQVKQAISTLMRIGPVTLEDVAEALRMHPRTLQRKLRADDAKFFDLYTDVRKNAAKAYISQSIIPLSHVAHILGFSDQSTFTRACVRWFGQSPKSMRSEAA